MSISLCRKCLLGESRDLRIIRHKTVVVLCAHSKQVDSNVYWCQTWSTLYSAGSAIINPSIIQSSAANKLRIFHELWIFAKLLRISIRDMSSCCQVDESGLMTIPTTNSSMTAPGFWYLFSFIYFPFAESNYLQGN